MNEHLGIRFEPFFEEDIMLVNMEMFHHMLSWKYYLLMELRQDHLTDFVLLYQNLKNRTINLSSGSLFILKVNGLDCITENSRTYNLIKIKQSGSDQLSMEMFCSNKQLYTVYKPYMGESGLERLLLLTILNRPRSEDINHRRKGQRSCERHC
jgi:hypothetical protein